MLKHDYMKFSEPKCFNSILNTIGVNSLMPGGNTRKSSTKKETKNIEQKTEDNITK